MVIDMYSCYVNNFSVAMEELKSTKAALSAFLTVRFDYMTYGERKKTVKHPLINLLYIPDLLLKLYGFMPFLYKLFPLRWAECMIHGQARAMVMMNLRIICP